MPHQCLKCGELFPDGSSQILRGCPECQGTRFFYTEEALEEKDRAKLLKQGEADIKTILNELTQGGESPSKAPAETPAQEPADDDEPPETTFEAVGTRKKKRKEAPPTPPAQETKVLPGNKLLVKLRKRKLAKRMKKATASRGWDYDTPDPDPIGGRKPSEPEEEPAAEPEADEESDALGGIPVVGRKPDEAAPWPGPAPEDEPAEDPDEAAKHVERVSYGDEPAVEPPSEPESPPERPSGAPQDPASEVPKFEIRELPESEDEDGVPETVRIDAPGQYAIDVKRLLEEAPIVVQKDGSYLIHLPSLFEGEEKQRAKGR